MPKPIEWIAMHRITKHRKIYSRGKVVVILLNERIDTILGECETASSQKSHLVRIQLGGDVITIYGEFVSDGTGDFQGLNSRDRYYFVVYTSEEVEGFGPLYFSAFNRKKLRMKNETQTEVDRKTGGSRAMTFTKYSPRDLLNLGKMVGDFHRSRGAGLTFR